MLWKGRTLMPQPVSDVFDRGKVLDRRGVWCGGVRIFGDWRVRYYVILPHDMQFDAGCHGRGLSEALALLPTPAVAAKRPGVGFVICHPAHDQAYIVLNWWDNRNELFQRVQISEYEPENWRPANGTASFCVWDSEIIWHERCAYVESVLARPDRPDVDRYLASHFDAAAARPQPVLEGIDGKPEFDDAWPTSAG